MHVSLQSILTDLFCIFSHVYIFEDFKISFKKCLPLQDLNLPLIYIHCTFSVPCWSL